MDTYISRRRDALNTIVLWIVVIVAIQVSNRIPDIQNSVGLQMVALLTSAGAYRVFITGLFWLINRWSFALRIYWGPLFLRGLWSYEYTLNNKIYIGIWDIKQDVNGIELVGNGLTENFRLRTIVRNVSPFIPERGAFFVINERNELENENAKVFSKTTLLLDRQKSIFGRVQSMRSTTEIFGGPSDRQLHPNVQFVRHDDVETFEELLNKLRRKSAKVVSSGIGQATPPASTTFAPPASPSPQSP